MSLIPEPGSFSTLYVYDGLVLANTTQKQIGMIRFNGTTFEGYTGKPGPLGEEWRSLLLEIAGATTLGGIKVGSNLHITSDGLLSAVAAGESRKFQNVYTVSNQQTIDQYGNTVNAGDFLTINEAISEINDLISSNDPDKPSQTNPYKIILSPGIYEEKISLPDYVSLQGEGSNVSTIRSLSGSNILENSAVVTLGNESRLEKITIENYEGNFLNSIGIYSSNKSNIVIDDVKIVMGESSTQAGIDVYGICMIDTINPKINNITIDIIKGTGNVYGMYFDPTSPIVSNSSVNINTNGTSNYNYGLFHLNNSNGEYRSCNINVSGGLNNIGIKSIKSTPYIYDSQIISNSQGTSNTSYGIYTEADTFITSLPSITYPTINVTFNNNFPNRDTISISPISATNLFTANNYIIVSGASLSKNNSNFYVENVDYSTGVLTLNSANILENYTNDSNVTINQLYTMKIYSSVIQATTSAMYNNDIDCGFVIEAKKSVIIGSESDPLTNNGLVFFDAYRTIVVSKDGGDFTSLSKAIESIQDNSEYRRYVINVKSGEYTESGQIIMKQYVNIIGSGRDTTIVNLDYSNSNKNDSSAIVLSSNTEISGITFNNQDIIGNINQFRIGMYGSDITNLILNSVTIISNGTSNLVNTGIFLENSNHLESSILFSDVKVIVNGTSLNTGIDLYGINSNLEIQNSEILIDSPTSDYNYGITSEESNFNISGTKIRVNGGAIENRGLNTVNTSLTNYMIQLFSCNITVTGTNDETCFAIYTCDHQSIIGGGSNLFGNNYYNIDELSMSILKLHSCWGTRINDLNVVEYYPISSTGVPISSLNGNLFIGDEAGNIGVTGIGNTAVGTQAGSSLTSASFSTMLGSQAGQSLTTGDRNTFIGRQAGQDTTTGDSNTFTGYNSGKNNETGSDNTAYGSESFFNNTTSSGNVTIGQSSGYNLNNDNNTFIGKESGFSSTTATENVLVGTQSGYSNTTGSSNVIVGFNAGSQSTTASNIVAVGHESGKVNTVANNTFLGTKAGYSNTTGQGQTMVGYKSGYTNTTGFNNTLLGTETGYSLQDGSANLLLGARAGYSVTSGSRNILMGSTTTVNGNNSAGFSLTTGSDDLVIGSNAGSSITSGSSNILLGTDSGSTLTSGTGNVFLGYQTGTNQNTQTGNIMIGNQAGKNTNNSPNIILIGDNAGSNSTLETSIFIGKEAGRNSSGSHNIGIGFESLKNQTNNSGTSEGNVFIGPHSGRNLVSGSRSVAIGGGQQTGSVGVLASVTNQNDNTVVGYLAGKSVVSDENTLIGSQSGFKINSGGLNSMLGFQSGYNTTTGQKNVVLGNQAGFTGTTSSENTFIGYQAGYSTNTQSQSVAIGSQAGFLNTSEGVVSIGYRAGYSNRLAPYNIFIGYESAGNVNKVLEGDSNIFIGYQAGYSAEGVATKNILIGTQSGSGLTTGQNNIFIGDQSGSSIGSGQRNVFIGPNSIGQNSSNTNDNIYIGDGAGTANVSGERNLLIGTNAGTNALTSDNICFGTNAGISMTIGERNIYVGNSAGYNVEEGTDNICIGYLSGRGSGIGNSNYSNSILIGKEAGLNNESDNFLSIGTQAGQKNTSGEKNINIGYQAGLNNIIGSNNVNIGAEAGLNSITSNNIFIGALSGRNNVDGQNNILVGANAGQQNQSGNNNIFMGSSAGLNSLTDNNIAIGTQAGQSNIDGTRNIYIGFRAGLNSLNSNNIFFGNEAGLAVTTGEGNLFMGSQSGVNTTTGSGNVFLGYQSGYNNVTGKNSMFIGFESGYKNQTGSDSLYLGYQAGYSNVSGSNNLAIGYRSQKLNTEGNQNIGIGNYALYGNKFGDNNMVFGTNAVSTGDIGNNNIVIGIDSSRNIKNPNFKDNIINGYRSNFQGFATTGSIVMGSNAIGEGIGGENNIVMGYNAGYNLGLPIQNISFGPGPYSNINVNKEGYNVVSVGSGSVKKGQYMVIIYDNNTTYEPQVVYTLATTSTEATISQNLVTDINLSTDNVYLLYGEKSTVVDNAIIGNNYVIVKTPKSVLDTLFNVNDKIIIQSLLSTDNQIFNIVSTSVYSGSTTTGTTKIIIDTTLSTSYSLGDCIYLARITDPEIGVADTSIASSNIIMGNNTAIDLTLGSKNIAMGDEALRNITTEKYNTAIGTGAGYSVQSDNNFLLGTKTGYYIDSNTPGTGENVMIGYATGQFAGFDSEASNNVYIGNRVGQVNQGSNNIFIGNEIETLSSANQLVSTTYSNKLAIYKTDSGVPTNPLIGGDLSSNKIGVLTMEPKSSLDVKGSFGKAITNVVQFNTNIDYQSSEYFDKSETSVAIENTPQNTINFANFSDQGICLVDSEFIIYNDKGTTSLNNLTRGTYGSEEAHHLNGSILYNIGAIKNITSLTIDVPSTGIISVDSTDNLEIEGLVVIDSEIIKYSGINGGLGQATRGYESSITAIHSAGSTCFNISSTVQPLINTLLTNNITDTQTTLPMDPTGFPATGNLIIDGEIMSYTDNTPFILNVTRGSNSTLADHHNLNKPIYLVQNNTTPLVSSPLENDLTGGNTQIKVVDLTDFVNQGYVILDKEIIQYGSVAAINLERGTNGTTPALHGINSVVTLISDNLNDIIYDSLDQAINEVGIIGVTGIPPNTIILNDASQFDTNGIILIEDEIISYTGKVSNYLINCIRGYNGTIAKPHGYGSKVYKLDQLLLGQGTIKLLSDSDLIMEFITGHTNFTKQGTLQVGSEIIRYTNKVLYDITRGIEGTPIDIHLAPKVCYNFSELVSTSTLKSTITDLTTNIPINAFNTLTSQGTILIESELITYSNGIGLYDVTRGVVDTPKVTHLSGAIIYSIPLLGVSHSKLLNEIQSNESGIPVIDNTLYSTSGMILIDSEIVAYQNKKTLDNTLRGTNNTNATSHLINTKVYELTAISALSSLGSQLAQGEDAIVLNSLTGFTAPGIAQVQTLVNNEIVTEIINFAEIGKSLVAERGAYGSTSIGHLSSSNVYEIEQTNNIPLGSNIEALDVSLIGSTSNNTFSSTGELLVGYEIFDYTEKNKSLGVTRNYRGAVPTTHLNNQPVYDIDITTELTLSTNLTGNSRFKTTDTGIPVISSISSYGGNGTIIVGSEIMNYGSKNNSLVLNSTSSRGLYNSTPSTHTNGSTVYNVDSIENINIVDQTIHDDFILLVNDNTLPSTGDVRVDKEVIEYTTKNNTITTSQRGGIFNTSASTHNQYSNVYNITIDGPTCLLMKNLDTLNEVYININDSSSFSETGGYALINDDVGGISEVIYYTSKNKTYINPNRGLDGTQQYTINGGEIFSLITDEASNIELLNDIDYTQTLMQLKLFDNDGNPLVTSSGYFLIDEELIKYDNINSFLVNTTRGYNSTTATSHANNSTVNKIRDYDNSIPLNNYSSINNYVGTVYQFSKIQRGTNNSTATSHNVGDTCYIVSDSLADINTYLVGDITAITTYIILNDVSEFNTNDNILIDTEFMTCLEIYPTINVIRVSRGALSSTATIHSNLSTVIRLLNITSLTLVGSITASETLLTFSLTNNQLSIPGNGTILIGYELIKYIADDSQLGVFSSSQPVYSTNNYSLSTIVRGTNSTTATPHVSSSQAILLTRNTTTLPTGTLSASLKYIETTITLTSGTYSNIATTSSGIILIENEIIKYTSTISGSYQLTGCIRGYSNTTVSYHDTTGVIVYKIDEPYFINTDSLTSSQTNVNIWPNNTPLNIINETGTFLIDNEIIQYTATSGITTQKILGFEPTVDEFGTVIPADISNQRLIDYLGEVYPPMSLSGAGTGSSGTTIIPSGNYGTGSYTVSASSMTTDYYPSLAFNSFDVSTTITPTLLTSSETSTITAGSTTDFPTSGYLLIESEIIQYTGKTGTTFTGLTRGCFNTTAVQHAIGTSIYLEENVGVAFNTLGTSTLLNPTDMGLTDTTITVQSTTSFPTSGYILIGSEIIEYTGKTATTFTGLTRGSQSTTVSTHYAGKSVYLYILSATVTTITVGSTIGFPTSGYLLIENEIIQYTGKTGTTFTGLTRGSQSTTATTHISGKTVYLLTQNYGWRSATSKYNSTTGAYTGSSSIPIGSDVYYGEWIKIQLPNLVIPNKFYIKENLVGRGNEVVIGASKDDITWDLFYNSSPLINENYIDGISARTYKYFVVVIKSIVPNNSITYASLKQFSIYSKTSERLFNVGQIWHPISTATQLQAINTNLIQNYYLTNNIDLTGVTWTPIGSSSPFTGIFDGRGFTISNLTYNSTTFRAHSGLFSRVSGTIRNLNLSSVTISANSTNVGGLVGIGLTNFTIDNCSISGTITTPSSSYGVTDACGMLIGYATEGIINKCYSTGSISINKGTKYIGGLIGGNTSSTITNCYSTVTSLLTATAVNTTSISIGGFVGYSISSFYKICYSTGFVRIIGSVSSSYNILLGGFIGQCDDTNNILNCYSAGNVLNDVTQSSYHGGFAGQIKTNNNVIAYCYSVGNVDLTGSVTGGGFVGIITGSTNSATSLFWDTTTSGTLTGIGSGSFTGGSTLTGKTTAEMKTQSTFTTASWNFTTIWNINNSYPNLTDLTSIVIRPNYKFTVSFLLDSNKDVTLVKSRLTRPHTASDTSISIVDSASFGNSGYLLIDKELIKYTSKNNNILNGVIRGVSTTNAVTQASGSTVYYFSQIPKLFYSTHSPTSTTEILYQLGPGNGNKITEGLIVVIDDYLTEFIKIGSLVGTNKVTHNSNPNILIDSELLSTTKQIKTTPSINGKLYFTGDLFSDGNSGNSYKLSLMDPHGLYIYLSSNTGNTIIKVRISDLTLVNTLAFAADVSNYDIVHGVIDIGGKYAYYCTTSYSGVAKIIKVDLLTLTVSSTIAISIATSLKCVVMDPTNTYIYVCNGDTPGSIYKINLSSFSIESTLALGGTYSYCTTGKITPNGLLGYFAVMDTTYNSNKIIEIDLSTFNSIAYSIILGVSDVITESVIQNDGSYGYFIVSGSPSRIIRIQLYFQYNSPYSESTVTTLVLNDVTTGISGGINGLNDMVIDTYSKYLYVINSSGNGIIVKIGIYDNNFIVNDVLFPRNITLSTNYSFNKCCIDPSNQYLYTTAAVNNSGHQLLKFDINYVPETSEETIEASNFNFETRNSMILSEGVKTFSLYDSSRNCIYEFYNSATNTKIIKIDLSSFSESVTSTLIGTSSNNNIIISGLIGSSNNYGYFMGYTGVGVSFSFTVFKIALSQLQLGGNIVPTELLTSGVISSGLSRPIVPSLVIDPSESFLYVVGFYDSISKINLQTTIITGYTITPTTYTYITIVSGLYGNCCQIDSSGTYIYIFGAEYIFNGARYYYCYKIRASDGVKIATSPLLYVDDYYIEMTNVIDTSVIDPYDSYIYATIVNTNLSSCIVKIKLSDISINNYIYIQPGAFSIKSSSISYDGLYGYFGSTDSKVYRVDLDNCRIANTITLSTNEQLSAGSVIDDTNRFLYFTSVNSVTSKSTLYKISISQTCMSPGLDNYYLMGNSVSVGKMEIVNDYQISASYDYIKSSIIDPYGEFSYHGTNSSPAYIIKYNTITSTVVSALQLGVGYNNLYGGVMDSYGKYAYFVTYSSSASVVRIDLSNFTSGGITYLSLAITFPQEITITSDGLYALIVNYTGGITPMSIVKVTLSTFTVTGSTLVLNGSGGTILASRLSKITHDRGNSNFIYIITQETPGKIIKINVNGIGNTTYVSYSTPDSGNNTGFFSITTDLTGSYAYIGEASTLVRIIKFNLNTMTLDSVLTSPLVSQYLCSTIINLDGSYVYFLSTDKQKILKIELASFIIKEYIYLPSYRNTSNFGKLLLNNKNNSIYTINSEPDASHIIQTSLNSIRHINNTGTEIEKMTLTKYSTGISSNNTLGLRSAVIDSTGTYAYFPTHNGITLSFVKFNLTTHTTTATYTVSPNDANSCYVSLIDPTDRHVYFATYVTTGNGKLYKLPLASFGSNVTVLTIVVSIAGSILTYGTYIRAGVITSDGSYAILTTTQNTNTGTGAVTTHSLIYHIDLKPTGNLAPVLTTTTDTVNPYVIASGTYGNGVRSAVITNDNSTVYLGMDNGGGSAGRVFKINVFDSTNITSPKIFNPDFIIPDATLYNYNSAVIDPSNNYIYFGCTKSSSSGVQTIVKIDIKKYNVSQSFNSYKFLYISSLTNTGYTSNSDRAFIDSYGKYAYFGTTNVYPLGVTKVNLNTFTVEDFFFTSEAITNLFILLKDPTQELCHLIFYYGTVLSNRTYSINLNTTLNNYNYSDFTSPININWISYNNGLLDSSVITITNSSRISTFSTSGGYILLVKYSSNALTNSVLLKYESVSGATLQNVTLAGTPQYLTSTRFDKLIYFKGNDNMVDGYLSGPILVGKNSIDTESNELIPIGSTLLRIKGDGSTPFSHYVLPTEEHRDVVRAISGTTINDHIVTSSITRIDDLIEDHLTEDISAGSVNIPISNGYLFGTSGLILIGSEVIAYNGGYGIIVTERGALNSVQNFHSAGISYRQYKLGTSTTVRTPYYNNPPSISDISVDSSVGLTSNINSKFMISSYFPYRGPEIVSGGSWNKSLDVISHNMLSSYGGDFNSSNNVKIYSLGPVVTYGPTTRSQISSTDLFIPIDDASGFPSQYNNVNYLLIDQEFIKLESRYSLDGLIRNKYSTQSAVTSTTLEGVTITSPSTLRQDITSDHIFIPLNNGSSYTSSGRVIIDGEWIQYNNKNSFDGLTRGLYSTIVQDYSYNVNIPLLLVNTILPHRNLRANITSTTQVIPLNGTNTSYNSPSSSNGIILIDNEIMKTSSKYSFDSITRQKYSTGLFTTNTLNYDIKEVNVPLFSTLRSSISAISGYIPVQIADVGSFTSGVGLIDGELFTWNSNNTLDVLTRGQQGTDDITHNINTGVNIVTQLDSYYGDYTVNNVTIIGDKVLLSDAVDGIRISDTEDINSFPLAGTVKIGDEYIMYGSNKTLADITRGTNLTNADIHTTDDIIYLLSSSITDLTVTTLVDDIVANTNIIPLTSVIGFSGAGSIVIDSEIINYSGISGNNLTGCSRGRFLSQALSHLSGTRVYYAPISNIYRSQITQDMKVDDFIVSIKDTNNFSSVGTVLIGTEIMTYQSKNALGKLTRGHDNTIPKGYPNMTPLTFTNITLTDQESTVLLDTSTGDINVDLPSAIDVKGRIYTIKKQSENNIVRIIPYDSEVIDDGLTSLPVTINNAFVALQSDGTKWQVILNSEEPQIQIETAKNEAISISNAYTDNAIANIQLEVLSTDYLPEGTSNLYFTNQRVLDVIDQNITTDNIIEGVSNLFFTDEKVILAMTGLYDVAGAAAQAEINATANATAAATANAISTIVAGAPTNLNTLNKIAQSLANNTNFYDVMIDLLAEKMNTTAVLSLLSTKLDVETATSLLAAKLNISDAALTYLTQSSAASTYLTQSSAASTYLTQSSAASTYLTQSSASSTYAPKADPTFTGLLTANNLKILSQLSMPISTVTQTGSLSDTVTINSLAGIITLFTTNIAISGNFVFSVSNTFCSVGDIVLLSSTRNGFLNFGATSIANNSFSIQIINNYSAIVSSSGTVSFLIIKKAV